MIARQMPGDDPLLDILGKLKLRTARLAAATAPGASFPSPLSVTALAVSPDGRRVAVGRANGLHFLDASSLDASGDPERPALEVKRLRFSLDGTVLSFQTADRAGTFLVDPPLPGIDIPGFGPQHDAFFAPARGALLRVDRTHVHAYDAATGAAAGQVAFVDSGGPDAKAPWRLLDVAVDGRFALCVRWRQGGVAVRRLDLATGRGPETSAPLPAPTGGGGAIAPGGAWAVVADGWGNFATIDFESMKFATPIVQEGRWTVWAVAASPDGRHWASARTREVAIWRLAAEHPLERVDLDAIDDVPRALAFAPDGALLVGTAAGRVLRIELARSE